MNEQNETDLSPKNSNEQTNMNTNTTTTTTNMNEQNDDNVSKFKPFQSHSMKVGIFAAVLFVILLVFFEIGKNEKQTNMFIHVF